MAFSRMTMRCAVLGAAMILAACTTKPVQQNALASAPAEVPRQAAPSSIIPGSLRDFEVNVGDTVHFDYQRADLRDEDRALLGRQAAWLNRYPMVRVAIQGNCDERGTRAYNLALGARRAQAVKDYLVSLGVDRARVDTISYGKERPVCADSTEECWARNRRAVTAITGGASS
jgi:peptidoglycan-associated lipoprotein